MRQIVLGVILLLLVCNSVVAQATTYYISPTGSNSNDGLSSGAPFLTFAYALDPTRASCGDTLNLVNGVYGDGTSTGRISLTGRRCTVGNELILRSVNSRQARINGNGIGFTIFFSDVAYITIDGLVYNSANNTDGIGMSTGHGFNGNNTDHITIKNSLCRNPNKYANNACTLFVNSRDGLVEDLETYDFHRHCITFSSSVRMVARRTYCNPRVGNIPGGYNSERGTGRADAVVSMYPCKDCIQENTIADGTQSTMYLNEMNAAFYGNILMSGSKLLGSICYRCSSGIMMAPRDSAGSNYSPQNIVVKHNAVVETKTSNGIQSRSGVNVTIDHNTLTAAGAINGMLNDDSALGASTTSFTNTNNIVKGFSALGFSSSGYTTWSGNNNFSNDNNTNYSPTLPSNWGSSVTTDPQMGTCYAWPPDGSNAANAGVGATILYRYQNGKLSNVPLWDPTTGKFPHGALVAGVNDVAGQSLFDVHKRLNVNTNGCSFPANYGDGVTDVDAPSPPANLSVS